ncbi:MAG: hypothetical protein AAFR21_11520 [Pseudomonadota bacterium]
MSDVIIRTGALPYEDGSGFEVEIYIVAATEYFDHERVVLNPGSEFTDFALDDWPEVRDAIDRAIAARRQLNSKEQEP